MECGRERMAETRGVVVRYDPFNWILVRHDPRRLEFIHIRVRKANEPEAQRQME
jgi:hypothetical protein